MLGGGCLLPCSFSRLCLCATACRYHRTSRFCTQGEQLSHSGHTWQAWRWAAAERAWWLPQVELVGRVQRQEQDCMWYTCINHVRVVGKPLYNFVPALGCRPCGAGGAPLTGAALRSSRPPLACSPHATKCGWQLDSVPLA